MRRTASGTRAPEHPSLVASCGWLDPAQPVQLCLTESPTRAAGNDAECSTRSRLNTGALTNPSDPKVKANVSPGDSVEGRER